MDSPDPAERSEIASSPMPHGSTAEPDRLVWDDRAAAAAAAVAVPGATRGASYGRDHSLAVGRGKRIGTIVSGCVLFVVAVAFAVAMLSQGGDADLRPSAAAKSPGVLQSSGASVPHQAGARNGGGNSQNHSHGSSEQPNR